MASRLLFTLLLTPTFLPAQSGGSQPIRYQAEYTQIYSDDVEAVSPSVRPGFVLETAGSLTSNTAEVISGTSSIKGAYLGQATHTPYLRTDPAVFPLSPNRSYRVTCSYRILVAPDKGFEVLFYSPTGASAGNVLPSQSITGVAGDSGTATLTNTLGAYSDYRAQWNIVGDGAIAIDDIQITDMAAGKVIATEDGESMTPNVASGLQLQSGATVVTDALLVIGGKAFITGQCSVLNS